MKAPGGRTGHMINHSMYKNIPESKKKSQTTASNSKFKKHLSNVVFHRNQNRGSVNLFTVMY